jgi:hypothetical protein
MASQPLNTQIQIYRTLRSERNYLGNDSIKAMTGRLRPQVLQIPGAEVPAVEVKTRDGNMGLSTYDEKGRPIVVGVRATTNFSVYETFTGVDFPVRIGQDEFIRNTSAGLQSATQSDLQQVARTVAAGA